MAGGTARAIGNQAIVASGLTKSFGDGETKVTAVKGVAFSAQFGRCFTLSAHPAAAKPLCSV